MAIAETPYLQAVREQLLDRRERLETAISGSQSEQLSHLLSEVDHALERVDNGQFGMCVVCKGVVEDDRLMHDPVISVCLDCLSPREQRALEYDLNLAARIQNGLLPPPDLPIAGWELAYHYRPAGMVSGDYCDVISDGNGGVYFVLADVAGKGVSAAMLTANLRAVIRALVPLGMSMDKMLSQANRLFCESKLPMQYATLVAGRSTSRGEMEIVNAGHLPALLVRDGDIVAFASVDLPLGLFCDQQFTATRAALAPGDTLVLYTDGICEAQNPAGEEYGHDALRTLIRAQNLRCPHKLVEFCRNQVEQFRAGGSRSDDETLLALQYAGGAHVTTV